MAAFVVAAPARADMTLSEDLTLTENADWRDQGVVTIEEGATLDLAGHVLQVSALAGTGSIVDSSGQYELLDFIQSSGAQCIDTDLTPDRNTKVDAVFTPTYMGGDSTLFGTKWGNNGFLAFGNSGGTWYGLYPNNGGTGKYTINHRYRFIVDSGVATLIDDETGTIQQNIAVTDTNIPAAGGKLSIFSCPNREANRGWFKMHSFKVWQAGEMLFYFVPARDATTGEVGLVNLLDGKMHASTSGTAFSAEAATVAGAVSKGVLIVETTSGAALAGFAGTVASTVNTRLDGDITLAGDADWTRFPSLRIYGTVDLAGHNLTVGGVAGAGTITDTVGTALSGYDRLDYIQATGTQYIDTGYRHDDTTIVDMRISFDVVVVSSWQVFYGARDDVNKSDPKNFGIFLHNKSPWFGPQLGAGRVDVTTYTVTAGTIYDIHLAKKGEECTATPEGGDVVSLDTGTATSNSSFSGNDYLLAMNRYFNTDSAWHAGFHTRAKLYSCKIYSGTLLKRDFVPVKRKSDGTLGLLDLAGGKFYGNAGTGKFNEGNIVATTVGGELRISVAEEARVDISDMALTGGLKVVKTGEGTLAMSKESQAYAGGTEVQGGTLESGAVAACVFGAEGAEVAVGSARNVDLNGNANLADYRWTVAAGGTIVNGGADISGALSVSGVFSPVATTGGFTAKLQDGATLDFTKWTGSFPVASPAISCASGANVTVALMPRTEAISRLAKTKDPETGAPAGYLLGAIPSGATFSLDAASSARFKLLVDENGLCVSFKRGFSIIVR